MGAHLIDNEPVRDLYWRALNRSMEVGDEMYVSALGRLVGAACDDAKVDEVGFLLAEVIKLEPVHLRAVVVPWEFYRRSGGLISRVPVETPTSADTAVQITIEELAHFATSLQVSQAAAEAIVTQRQLSSGFLTHIHVLGGLKGHTASRFGRRALQELFPQLEVEAIQDDR